MVFGHPLVLSPVIQAQLAGERIALDWGPPLVAGAGIMVLGDLSVAHPLVLSPVVQALLAGVRVALEGSPLVETDTLALGDLAVAHPHHDSKCW